MTRNDLIEAGALAWAIKTHGEALADIIDAVEPLIRADERAQAIIVMSQIHQDKLADLRAEVAALLAYAEADPHGSERSSAYATVLHLIDRATGDKVTEADVSPTWHSGDTEGGFPVTPEEFARIKNNPNLTDDDGKDALYRHAAAQERFPLGEDTERKPFVKYAYGAWVAADAGGWTDRSYATEAEAREAVGLPVAADPDPRRLAREEIATAAVRLAHAWQDFWQAIRNLEDANRKYRETK